MACISRMVAYVSEWYMLSLVLPERKDMRAPTPRTSETAGPVPAAHRPPPILPGGEGRSRKGQSLAQGLKTWDPSRVAISDVPNLSLSFPSVLWREQQQAAVKTQNWPQAALPSTQAGPTSTFCLSSHRCRQREPVFSTGSFVSSAPPLGFPSACPRSSSPHCLPFPVHPQVTLLSG